ncbi:MAG: Subtilisin-like protein serine protease [Candidatus Saccharibacteria bacterium]|nr:Subtilisin-like protein serine protease [Candidatus Saccharibacteria bacterium]
MNKILHKSSRIFSLYGLVLCLVVALVPSRLVFADANKLYITPASSQMNIGTSFSVNVRSYADVDAPTGTVRGTVTFPVNLLQVTGISTAGSQYNAPSISQGSGTIGFSASRSPAPSGAAQIFSVTFKATGSGTATVNFSGDSQVNNTTTTYTAGIYTITNPNPPASSTPVATPKPSASVVAPVPIVTAPTPTVETAPTEPVATPDPTGLITGVAINPLYSTATVTWNVNATNPGSTLTYGSSSSQLDKKATVTKKADGSFTTAISELTPGNRYYFVISGNGDGGKSGTYSDTIITPGFPVAMTITENNVAVKNAQIKIGNRNYTSGADGKKTIGLAAGSYTGTITTDTASLTINLTVATKPIPQDGTAPESQAVSYNLSSSPLSQAPGSENSIFAFIGILLGGTVVLGLGFVGFMAYRRRRFESGVSSSHAASSTVVIQDGYDWRSQIPNETTPVQPAVTHSDDAEYSSPTHNNSVHITEQEPLDMFEQARQNPLPTPREDITSDSQDVNQQNPSSPHSTKL